MSFEIIWEKYEKELSFFVFSRVRDKEIQKDIMQEIALKIFTSLHLQKDHLRGWIYQITKNVIIDYYRKFNKPLPEVEDVIVEEPEEHVLTKCLMPMLSSLKTEDKEVLELSQLKQYSLKEIALKKDLPFNTVKSKLFRAKKLLSQKFFSCCTYEFDVHGNVIGYSDCKNVC